MTTEQFERWCTAIAGLIFTAALLAMVASTWIGNDQLKVDGTERGFLWAPNWTATPLILAPLLIISVWINLRLFENSVLDMWEAGMLRSRETLVAVTREQITKRLRDWRRRVARAWLLLSMLGIVGSVGEWWVGSGRWVWGGDLATAKARGIEIDWSVANLVGDVDRLPVLVFGLLAFTVLQGGVLCAIALFLSSAFHSTWFFLRMNLGRSSLIPLPVDDPDVRRGFQRLEDWGSSLFLSCITLIAIFYLTRIQNVYLHTTGAGHWLDLITDPMTHALAGEGGWFALLTPHASTDFSSLWIFIGVAVIGVIALAVPVGLLMWTAKRAHYGLQSELHRPPPPTGRLGQPLDKVKRTLEGMQFWPYRYLHLNGLIALAVIACASLLWVGLLPFLLGTSLVISMTRVLGLLHRVLGSPP